MALTTEDLVLTSWHEDLLKDGGPENYNKCAPEYDERIRAIESAIKINQPCITYYNRTPVSQE